MDYRNCESAGHGYGSRQAGKTDPGAVSKYGVEAVLNRRLSKRLAYDHASCKVPTLFRDNGRYYLADDQAKAFGATRFKEIHFNSGPKGASGVEVLVGPNPSPRELSWAKDVGQAIASAAGLRFRGVDIRDDLAVLRQYKDMASILVEVAFLSNSRDIERYLDNEEEIELAIFNADRKSVGRAPMKTLPRKTWRRRRVPKYLKTV